MKRSRPTSVVASAATTLTLVTVGAVAIAACGSSGGGALTSHGGGAAATTPRSASASSGSVAVATSSLGKILVNPQGKTLYLWQADTGPKSTCSGACAAAWPPLLTTGAPTAGGGVDASLLGTTKRSGGEEQVTYNRHPLYLFTGDTGSGQTNGEGSTSFGALWYVLSPAGSQITRSAAPSARAGGSGSAAGY